MNKISITTLLMAICLSTLAQTKTFDYLNAGLANDCNVFDPAVTIDGASHTSWAGGVIFNTTNGLGLSTQKKLSPPKSTAFKINYSFISGVNYSIQLTASGNSDVLLNTSVVPNVTNFVTSSQTACAMDAYAYSYSTAGYGQFSSATTTSSATYTIPQFSIPSGNSGQYLFIWASGGRPSSDLDVLFISKIIITPTPIVSFNLSSSTPTIPCGATTPVTFTVTNGGNTTVTGHTWNLGSANNGWLYNGSAAPATITTGATVNAITLTPVCGSALSNVSATVTANATNYNTNASSVAITQPNLTILGNSNACSSEDYFVSGLPCNATVSWSIFPTSGVATIFPYSGSSTTVTKVANGNLTLTATIQNTCGVQLPPIQKTIKIGEEPLSSYTVLGAGTVYANAGYTYTLGYHYTVTASNFFWRVPDGWTIVNGQGTNNINVLTGSTGGAVQIDFDNNCGQSTGTFKTVEIGSGGPLPERMANTDSSAIKIFPNPAVNHFTITLETKNKISYLKEVIIKNKLGFIVFRKSYSSKTRQQTFDISHLKTDVYVVEVFDGVNRTSQKLSIVKF